MISIINKDLVMKKLFWAAAVLVLGCGEDSNSSTPVDDAPTSYEFPSRGVDPTTSSVSYSGQIMRHVLLEALTQEIGDLTSRIDDGSLVPSPGNVESLLNFYYRFDSSTSGTVALPFSLTPQAAQSTFDDLSTGKDLSGKIAGNDPIGQHADWTTDMAGWDSVAVTTPESLVDHWFAELDSLAVARANGTVPQDPAGSPIAEVYVSEQGHDLRQLLQKFIGVAVFFSQGTDDYLDDNLETGGIRASNSVQDTYSDLEHHWDEAFGYFGAARDFGDYTDDEIAAKGGRAERQNGYFDSNGDSQIDLFSEFNFGHSVNAAKRDRGSVAATDLTTDAFEAFVDGRHIISQAGDMLSDEEFSDLLSARDRAVLAWEKSIAATVVHYINEVIVDTAAIGTGDYDFLDHAKHWSEMKGFALGLQFNPRSPLSSAQFVALHQHIAMQPVLTTAGAGDYTEQLLDARALPGSAYGFDSANLGENDGTGGW
jgi:hypothetical protein